MKYLDLSNAAKENTLIDYCNLMQVDVEVNRKETTKWFIEKNYDLFNVDGLLTHRDRKR
tara:strand:+ start:309 stop:485 length:177 start_codon:yes stop_codon:yes gene_type:complete